jgi:kumamolisin
VQRALAAALGALVGLGIFAPGTQARPGAQPSAAAPPPGAIARLGPAPAPAQLQLVLPLRANVAGLERFATAVTTIGSPLYGDYQPIQTLARRFGATADDRALVLRDLRRAGARNLKIDATGLFADATMKVSLAQRLFGTRLGRYRGPRASSFVAPSGGVHVPAALGGAVTGVVGLDTRPIFTAPVSTDNFVSGYQERTGTAAGCPAAIADRGFTPNQYLTAYDYAPLQAEGLTGQGERIALIEIDGFRYSDLQTFAACFSLPVPSISAYGVGIKHLLSPGGETTLDLELLDAAAPGLAGIDVYESRSRASDVLRSLTAPLQNRGRVPDIISASLGTCEAALKLEIGISGARSAEGALALAAASGISVLASSGDAGSSSCIGQDGPLHMLSVSFPASSPYVTGVGATNVQLTSANQIASQTVWNDAPENLSAGGGGLSVLFPRPSYQDGLVARNHRGVPDVSLLGDVLPGYDIFCTSPDCLAGSETPWIAVGGTSAAAPLFAGGLALIDGALRAQHKQNLGLTNSLLYRVDLGSGSTGVISDVTTNDNDLGRYLPSGDGRALGCCSAGPGYDLASGLGSVDLGRFALLAGTLQPLVAGVGLSLPPQHAVARHHLLARLSCSRRCIAAAIGTVVAGSSFGVGSGNKVFAQAGSKIVKLRFSPSELAVLRRALRRHQPIYARVFGEVVDAGGNVEAMSSTQTVRIGR